MRPQLGSPAESAVLTNGELPIVRLTGRAARAVAAPVLPAVRCPLSRVEQHGTALGRIAIDRDRIERPIGSRGERAAAAIASAQERGLATVVATGRIMRAAARAALDRARKFVTEIREAWRLIARQTHGEPAQKRSNKSPPAAEGCKVPWRRNYGGRMST